jgi:hypothetical protein
VHLCFLSPAAHPPPRPAHTPSRQAAFQSLKDHWTAVRRAAGARRAAAAEGAAARLDALLPRVAPLPLPAASGGPAGSAAAGGGGGEAQQPQLHELLLQAAGAPPAGLPAADAPAAGAPDSDADAAAAQGPGSGEAPQAMEGVEGPSGGGAVRGGPLRAGHLVLPGS